MSQALYIVYKDNNSIEHQVYFDAVFSINHVLLSEASEFPLEDGSPMTDHVINKPDTLSFTAGVSNAPFQQAPGMDVPGKAINNPLAITYPVIFPEPLLFPPLEYPQAKSPPIGALLNPVGALTAGIDALTPNPQPQRAQQTKPATAPGTNLPSQNFINQVDRVQDMWNELQLIREKKWLCEIITQAKTYTNMILESVSLPVTADSGNAAEFSINAKQIRVVKLTEVDKPKPAELIAAVKKASGSKNATTNPKSDAHDASATNAVGQSPRNQQQSLKNKQLQSEAFG